MTLAPRLWISSVSSIARKCCHQSQSYRLQPFLLSSHRPQQKNGAIEWKSYSINSSSSLDQQLETQVTHHQSLQSSSTHSNPRSVSSEQSLPPDVGPHQAGSSSRPWFIDDDSLAEDEQPVHDKQLHSSPQLPPPPPPSNLPSDLLGLYEHLIHSPLLDPSSITFIDAKSERADAAWTDWVVLVSLKEGRERSVRGAAEGIKAVLEKNNPVRVEGVNKSLGSSSQQLSLTWAMIDGGKVVIHVFDQQSRQIYDLESVWRGSSNP